MNADLSTTKSVQKWHRRLSLLPWAVPGARRISYVGWTGFGNLGDEAMFEVHRKVFSGFKLLPVPGRRVLDAMSQSVPPFIPVRAVLGGGTLIGYPGIRLDLEALRRASPNLRIGMLGSGVEIPDEATFSAVNLNAELAEWVPILKQFDEVTVRGPLSAARLQDFEIPARVVGDPALLCAPGWFPGIRSCSGLIGINLGIHPSISEDQQRNLVSTFSDLCRRLVGFGLQVRIMPVWGADIAICKAVLAASGLGVHMIRTDQVTDTFLASAAECQLVIAQKLHAAVLSAAVGVPAIAVEYQPKCRDFQASVGREDYCFRYASVSAAELADAADRSLRRSSEERSDLARRTGSLRSELLDAAARLRSHVVAE